LVIARAPGFASRLATLLNHQIVRLPDYPII
jgi:hypothetical protein